MSKSGWFFLPAAFFFVSNFCFSAVKIYYFSHIVFFSFFFILFFILRQYDLRKIIKWSGFFVSFIIFFYGIIQKYILFPMILDDISTGSDYFSKSLVGLIKTGRIYSIFALPTLYAIVCVSLILFLFHHMIHSNKLRYIWGILLGMGIFNLVLTQSFGGIISLTAGILVYLLLSGILKVKYLAPVLMFLSLIFFVVTSLRFSEARELEPVKLRFSNWTQATRLIVRNPLIGVGLGNYRSEISQYTYSGEARSIYAHNAILQMTAEMGIFFPIFLGLLIITYRNKIIRKVKKENVLFITLVMVLIFYNLVDIGFYFFPASLICVIALSQIFPSRVKDSRAKGIILFGTGCLLALILLFQNYSHGYQMMGEFLKSQNNYIDAEINYRKSLRFNPFNMNSLVGYSHLRIKSGKLEEAENSIKRVLSIHPKFGFAHYLQSVIQYRQRRVVASLYSASRALQFQKQNKEYKRWYEFLRNHIQIGRN